MAIVLRQPPPTAMACCSPRKPNVRNSINVQHSHHAHWRLRSCFVRVAHPVTTTTTMTALLHCKHSPLIAIAQCSSSSLPLPPLVPRRACLLVLLAASLPLPAVAATATSVAAPALPQLPSQPSFLQSLGLGDADLYYPSFFEGTWNCFSTLTAVETPQGEDKADRRSLEFSRKQLGFTVEYQARFVPFQGHVIGDRSFTTSSLVESTMGKDVIKAASWDPRQPNRPALTLRGGVKVENVVTKRSAEATGPSQFDTSEFSKQVFDNSAIKDGPPSVKARQNLTRYRWDPTETAVNEIEAFQRVAMFRPPGEEMDLADVMGMDKPMTLYKYRVKFTRATGLELQYTTWNTPPRNVTPIARRIASSSSPPQSIGPSEIDPHSHRLWNVKLVLSSSVKLQTQTLPYQGKADQLRRFFVDQ